MSEVVVIEERSLLTGSLIRQITRLLGEGHKAEDCCVYCKLLPAHTCCGYCDEASCKGCEACVESGGVFPDYVAES